MRIGDRILQKIIAPLAWHRKPWNKGPDKAGGKEQEQRFPSNLDLHIIVYVCLCSCTQTYSVALHTSYLNTQNRKRERGRKREGWEKWHWFLEEGWDKVPLCYIGWSWTTGLKLILLCQPSHVLGLQASTTKSEQPKFNSYSCFAVPVIKTRDLPIVVKWSRIELQSRAPRITLNKIFSY